MRTPFLLLAATLVLAVGGCAGSQEPTDPVTVTVIKEVPAPAVTVTARPAQPSQAPTTAQPTQAPPAEVVPPPPAVNQVMVPDGVGHDYQTAQDMWRAVGLVVLPAVDGLGLDRWAVLDSNWVVLSQDVPAGSTVDEGTSITATIVKFTDL